MAPTHRPARRCAPRPCCSLRGSRWPAAPRCGRGSTSPWRRTSRCRTRRPPVSRRGRAPIVAAVTLSGGGARAAAFGLGVLQELKATRFELDGRETTLLDEVGLISGVSGGSVLASYYAAFGDEIFTRFERDFLLVNFQSELIRDMASPGQLVRAHLALVRAQQRPGAAPGHRVPRHDLRRPASAAPVAAPARHGHRPDHRCAVRIHARAVRADLLRPRQRAAVVRRRRFVVGAAAAEPDDRAQPCGQLPALRAAWTSSRRRTATSRRACCSSSQSYRNAQQRPYIHLVDGGLVDNLGVRSLVDRIIAGGSLDASFRRPAAGLGAQDRAHQRELRARHRRPHRPERPRAEHRSGAGLAGLRRRLATDDGDDRDGARTPRAGCPRNCGPNAAGPAARSRPMPRST